MIAGRLHWRARGAKVSKPRGLAAFDFPNGTLLLTEAGSQKRASLHVVAGEAGLRALDPGGLEVLDTDLEHFAAALTSANHTLKRALSDPRLFSGIGNAYSDEILFEARLSPLALTQKLSARRDRTAVRSHAVDALPAGSSAFAKRPARASRRKSRHSAKAWRYTAATSRPARGAARTSSASATPPTKPTIARGARPMENCWPTAPVATAA